MPKFSFQLDGVLRHRQIVEHERQRVLAEVQARMTRLEAELRALDEEVRASNESMRLNHLTGRLDLNLLAAHRRYLGATQRRAMGIAQDMAVVQRSMDEARVALAAAALDRKVLEKLRERQQAAWQADVDRSERTAADEVATQMSYRKGRTAAGDA